MASIKALAPVEGVSVMGKQIAVAVVVPAAILVITIICKLLIHGKDIKCENFFMGIDVMMAALASGLIYVCEIFYAGLEAHDIVKDKDRADRMEALFWKAFHGGGYCVMVVGVLFFMMLLHQRWERVQLPAGTPLVNQRNVMLLGISNSMGFGCLGSILYFVGA